eukprot:366406-Chlamydomonas_euryale.AAC.14
MALQQAVVALFGQKTLPSEDEIPAVAHKLFVEVVHSVDDGSDTEITTSDLYKYLVLRSDVSVACMHAASMKHMPHAWCSMGGAWWPDAA